ncbi:hypothetical protein BFP72_08375 [Reichenbachiella sp. 5M10]|uniref:universal stress protein n=1 Tax=Reichenbachiella sp. 5M10 TaxID=1889772 RepID=UPI000C15EE5F|nr:universal stress protein [Reichenbachiella sp. 5M10]PIB35409.1 hypothetical protein BFP72_08375 [Reichenbachiella sp. 5M10]
MKKILVPYDFSEYAKAALALALEISDASQGEVTLLHIIEYPTTTTFNVSGEISYDSPMDKLFTMQLINRTKEQLQAVLDQPEHSQHNLTYRTMMGNTYTGISAEIEAANPDLIVMGTKGATGLQELLIGSNTEKVVRTAKCPVLTVHEARAMSKIKNIVYPTDLDTDASHVLAKFKEYQAFFGAKIHLVYVDTPHSVMDDEIARNALNKFAENNELTNYDTHIAKGFQPDEAIMNFTKDINADMIALATHSHRGLLHLFVGSIAEDLVNHSIVPVWTMSQKK